MPKRERASTAWNFGGGAAAPPPRRRSSAAGCGVERCWGCSCSACEEQRRRSPRRAALRIAPK
eukprot:scaffold15582_cov66-Phaeocystis_antarctica.AAC.4